MFPTSFKASTLHVNREPGCGVTEFLCTEVWFPDKENETLSPSPYESNMHANFFFLTVPQTHTEQSYSIPKEKKS